jgi:acetyl esterase/lipase
MKNKSIGPIQDAQQAIKLVRQRAGKWNINPHHIGIMGFSAGGHLAAMAGTHFGHNFIADKKGTSLRPDFMMLIYPVISFTDSIGHIGSRNNLLGPSPSKTKIKYYSNEFQVSSATPQTFLAQASEDSIVSVKNSLYFYEALRKHNVPAELHIYEKGNHGFLDNPPFQEWFGDCIYWLKSIDML